MTGRPAGHRRAVALLAGLAVGAAGCSAGGGAGSPAAGPPAPAPPADGPAATGPPASPPPTGALPELAWRPCGDSFDCATLSVPLDPADPAAAPVPLAVARLPATGARIGALVVNPGGPGGSGVAYARAARTAISPAVRERFDIVGFDPRGTGASAPVHCLPPPALDRVLDLDPSPDDPAERAELGDGAAELAAGCAAGSSTLLAHVGTADTVGDLDLLRVALGEQRLTFLGKSYGTLLGAAYADRFPDRVRAAVLDGAVDPSLDALALGREQAVAFEAALGRFLDDCVARSSCPLGRPRAGAQAALDRLLAEVERRPLPAGGGRSAGPAAAFYALAAGLYSPRDGWPALRDAFARAGRGDGTGLRALADGYLDRAPDGRFAPTVEANVAISCVDQPYPTEAAAYDDAAAAAGLVAPHFGAGVVLLSLVCRDWPVPATRRPGPLRAVGSPPVLVVGTVHDPATPYAWAQSLARQLSAGRLLGYEGDGHTAYGGRSACVDEAVDRYLVDLALPAEGTVCR